jgi:hypothetical protein
LRDDWRKNVGHGSSPPVITALTIADINVGTGDAEIWDGEQRLARLSKHGGVHATFWRVT